MDNEYIENIVGSPFVNERGWDQFKAQMAPRVNWRSKESPEILQIKSLWKGFSRKLLNISQGVMQNTDYTNITPEQKTLADQFLSLYRTIHAIEYKEKYSPEISLKEILGGQDPSQKSKNYNQFLDDSKKKIIAAYNEFISNVSKVTGRTREKVVKFVSEISPQKYAKIIQKIQGFFSTPDLVPPVPGTPSPPLFKPSTVGSTPVTPPGAAAGGIVTPTPSTTIQPSSATGSEEVSPSPATLFAELVNYVVEKITKLIESDATHYNAPETKNRSRTLKAAAAAESAAKAAAKAAAAKTVTTTPATTSTPKSLEEKGEKIRKGKDDEEKFEPTGKFLYDFAGYYDKSRHFGVPITDGEIITLTDGKPRYIKIIWSCNNFENIIRVQFKTDGTTGETKSRDLFKFYDHEAYKKTSSSSPPEEGENVIKKYLHTANPYEGDLLAQADSKIRDKLKSNIPAFNDAIHNVIYKKAVEFVSGKKGGEETNPLLKYPSYKDAVDDLLRQKEHKPGDIDTLVTKAWNDLVDKDKKNPDEITKDQLINKIRNTDSNPDIPTPTLQPSETPSEESPTANVTTTPVSTTDPTAPVSSPGGTDPTPANVTAPVSTNDPTAPVSSPEPTAPVSNAGKEKKKGGFTPRVRREGGELVYIDDAGQEHPMDDDQVLRRIRTDLKMKQRGKDPHFLKALIDAGLYDKYKELANQRSKTEEIINPFQKSNFLY